MLWLQMFGLELDFAAVIILLRCFIYYGSMTPQLDICQPVSKPFSSPSRNLYALHSTVNVYCHSFI